MDDSTFIIVSIGFLCFLAFGAGFICSNELIVRKASRPQGYTTNRGTIIKVVSA